MPDVVIAIPSFRRPKSLDRTLQAVEKLNTHAKITVLVADNDSDTHEALDLCIAIRDRGYRWPLDSFTVVERGIANVRNALVARALANSNVEFVAMLDDDEAPVPNWIDEFLRVQEQTRADVLNGSTKRIFETDPGAWVVHCDGVSDIGASTGPISMLESTGNFFAHRRVFDLVAAPWFDRAFGLAGGEDKDFFVRARKAGARFAWANDAVLYDFVPPSRANLKWAMRRAYSAGNSDMRVFLKHRPALGAMLREALRIAGALLLNPVLFIILIANPNRRVRPMRKLCRAFGKIAAMSGRHYDEYSVIHGQ